MMCTGLDQRGWLRSVLSGLICLWLGIGPLLASSSVWEAKAECCCGGENVCLLGGCDCGETVNARLGDCGGLRSADGANDGAVAVSFARHLGLIPIDLPVIPLLPTGRISEDGPDQQVLPTRAPDPPPPRLLGVL